MHRFGPAAPGEETVFGAYRPGYCSNAVNHDKVVEWLSHVLDNDVERVCCLLTDDELSSYYEVDLLQIYRDTFGKRNVLHSPVTDFTYIHPEQFHGDVLPFLQDAESTGQRVVVHCSGGVGRTGHVLALWLMVKRGYGVHEAVDAVGSGEPYRNPLEAAEHLGRKELERIARHS